MSETLFYSGDHKFRCARNDPFQGKFHTLNHPVDLCDSRSQCTTARYSWHTKRERKTSTAEIITIPTIARNNKYNWEDKSEARAHKRPTTANICIYISHLFFFFTVCRSQFSMVMCASHTLSPLSASLSLPVCIYQIGVCVDMCFAVWALLQMYDSVSERVRMREFCYRETVCMRCAPVQFKTTKMTSQFVVLRVWKFNILVVLSIGRDPFKKVKASLRSRVENPETVYVLL